MSSEHCGNVIFEQQGRSSQASTARANATYADAEKKEKDSESEVVYCSLQEALEIYKRQDNY